VRRGGDTAKSSGGNLDGGHDFSKPFLKWSVAAQDDGELLIKPWRERMRLHS
jgi:hypothetical protein